MRLICYDRFTGLAIFLAFCPFAILPPGAPKLRLS